MVSILYVIINEQYEGGHPLNAISQNVGEKPFKTLNITLAKVKAEKLQVHSIKCLNIKILTVV